MEKKKKSAWAILNPLEWILGAFKLFAWVMGPILRWLGMMPPPRTDGFENIQKRDVDEAAEQATRSEEAVDAIMRDMSPADVVKAYARADSDTRSSMDLSVLDLEGQDWLLSLSEEDLDLLGMSTTGACARSLEAREVKAAYPKPRPETEAPEILSVPSAEDTDEWKRQQIAERFRQVQQELWLSPGVPNPKPKHAAFTLH